MPIDTSDMFDYLMCEMSADLIAIEFFQIYDKIMFTF